LGPRAFLMLSSIDLARKLNGFFSEDQG
jgi:hypothetical protein